jgi:hypothetical protein
MGIVYLAGEERIRFQKTIEMTKKTAKNAN